MDAHLQVDNYIYIEGQTPVTTEYSKILTKKY